MSSLFRSLTIAAAAALVTVPAHAQAKSPASASSSSASPFVGVWELNLAKSDLGPAAAQAPSKATMTITKSGNVLTLAQAVVMGAQEQHVSTDYPLIGRDTTTTAPDGLPVTNDGTISDSTVSLTSKLQRQGMDITLGNHWALSPDRRTLTVVQDTQTPMGAMKMTLVYDKKQ